MIIDTSALIAIFRAEDDASDMALAIERAQVRKISAANYLETAVVIDASRDPSPAAASTSWPIPRSCASNQ